MNETKKDSIAVDLLTLEAVDTVAQIFALDESEKTAAADLMAGFFDKAGEHDFANRVREARADGDRLVGVFKGIEAELDARRAARGDA